eukprot:9540287-Lingulodinium_polyedra.AAC.1
MRRPPCHHAVVDAWSTRVAKCAAFDGGMHVCAFLSSSDARVAQKRVQKCIRLLQRRSCRSAR